MLASVVRASRTGLRAASTVAPLDKIVYTAKTHTTGGREGGVATSSDGNLKVWPSVFAWVSA